MSWAFNPLVVSICTRVRDDPATLLSSIPGEPRLDQQLSYPLHSKLNDQRQLRLFWAIVWSCDLSEVRDI
jgi:hypothetical protein